MKQLLLLASLLGCTLNITAQNEEPWRNNGHFEIGFSADAWNLEIGYARMFTRWLGIGASLQMDNDTGFATEQEDRAGRRTAPAGRTRRDAQHPGQ